MQIKKNIFTDEQGLIKNYLGLGLYNLNLIVLERWFRYRRYLFQYF